MQQHECINNEEEEVEEKEREEDREEEEAEVAETGSIEDEDMEVQAWGTASAQKAAAIKRPRAPTKEERQAHRDAVHLPFSSWCKNCVRGKSKRPAHKKIKKTRVREVPTFHVDYMFPTGKTPVLVGKDDRARITVGWVLLHALMKWSPFQITPPLVDLLVLLQPAQSTSV